MTMRRRGGSGTGRGSTGFGTTKHLRSVCSPSWTRVRRDCLGGEGQQPSQLTNRRRRGGDFEYPPAERAAVPPSHALCFGPSLERRESFACVARDACKSGRGRGSRSEATGPGVWL